MKNKKENWVLVWHTGYKTPKKAKYKNDFGFALPIFQLDGDNGLDGEVTHWMPLPEPPYSRKNIGFKASKEYVDVLIDRRKKENEYEGNSI